jgi:hypothetical protein
LGNPRSSQVGRTAAGPYAFSSDRREFSSTRTDLLGFGARSDPAGVARDCVNPTDAYSSGPHRYVCWFAPLNRAWIAPFPSSPNPFINPSEVRSMEVGKPERKIKIVPVEEPLPMPEPSEEPLEQPVSEPATAPIVGRRRLLAEPYCGGSPGRARRTRYVLLSTGPVPLRGHYPQIQPVRWRWEDMGSFRRHLALASAMVAATMVCGLSPVPVGAAQIIRADGNDTAGPLDLARVKLTEIRGGDRFEIRTLSAFTASQLDGSDGGLEILFDTDADAKYERWALVFYGSGKIQGLLGGGHTTARKVPAHRVDPRTVSVDITHASLPARGSYDFTALSYWSAKPCSDSKPCIDVIPNRYGLIRHDWTAPTIAWTQVPAISTDASASLTFPVGFTVKDDRYGSGLDHWTLQGRGIGGAWTDIESGTSATPTVAIEGTEGAHYEFRVIAIDRQGNARTLAGAVTDVPWDDRNAVFEYSTPPILTNDVGEAFLGTTSVLATGTTITVTAPIPAAENLCILSGPTGSEQTAYIELWIDGVHVRTLPGSDYRSQNCAAETISAGAQITFEVVSAEPYVFDGLVLYRVK